MQYNKIADLIEKAKTENKKISQIVIEEEVYEREIERSAVIDEMKEHLKIMRESITEGLTKGHKSATGLTGGEALTLQNSSNTLDSPLYNKVIVKALAVSEVNACMGKIVAGPTAGASGIVPAVLITLTEEYSLDEDKLINALFTAGGLGEVVSKKATLAGAAGGCQAECGVGSAMAAGAAVELMGGSPKQVGDAFALALKNLLGLVCDPVAGLVEIPCVKRNGFAASHALTAVNMALSGIGTVIPPDEVIEAMMEIGDLMPVSLKETSEAGLAKTKTGQKIADNLQDF
ncbi:MAG TPA: L-serine ammonia-lyase, iron-sulfur-dependent, subunit alpha [Halanaerobiales bacterium]|nr:L-serine ammonia-lyase, iron-sulfur-dependent, subunit alpha [Halanaerobiales bacterium]